MQKSPYVNMLGQSPESPSSLLLNQLLVELQPIIMERDAQEHAKLSEMAVSRDQNIALALDLMRKNDEGLLTGERYRGKLPWGDDEALRELMARSDNYAQNQEMFDHTFRLVNGIPQGKEKFEALWYERNRKLLDALPPDEPRVKPLVATSSGIIELATAIKYDIRMRLENPDIPDHQKSIDRELIAENGKALETYNALNVEMRTPSELLYHHARKEAIAGIHIEAMEAACRRELEEYDMSHVDRTLARMERNEERMTSWRNRSAR